MYLSRLKHWATQRSYGGGDGLAGVEEGEQRNNTTRHLPVKGGVSYTEQAMRGREV